MLKPATGILGGTFDPIHFGHLRTAIELQQTLELSSVRLIPCHQPVHRKSPTTSPTHRLAMAKLAIIGEPSLTVDTCEIEREAPSFTVDTLELLRAKLPSTPLCLFMGIDALLGLPNWHRWQEILTLAHIVVAHRPHYELPTNGIISDLLKKHLQDSALSVHQQLAGHIILQSVTALEISATYIRDQFLTNKNPRYLLPDSVYNYIKEQKVYV